MNAIVNDVCDTKIRHETYMGFRLACASLELHSIWNNCEFLVELKARSPASSVSGPTYRRIIIIIIIIIV